MALTEARRLIETGIADAAHSIFGSESQIFASPLPTNLKDYITP